MFVVTFYILCMIEASFLLTEAQQQRPIEKQNSSTGQKNIEILADSAKIAIFNRDAGDLPPSDAYKTLTPGSKSTKPLSIGSQHRIRMEFTVKNKVTGAPIAVHQAFLVFSFDDKNKKDHEVIFIAEQEKTGNNKAYVFTLDMKSTAAKDFSRINGRYQLALVLGDVLVTNPMYWVVADLDISLPRGGLQVDDEQSNLPKSRRINYQILPEIHHQFRPKEAHPSTIVSDTFAVLCAVPMIFLLPIMWSKIGINIDNFFLVLPIWSLLFHGGLSAIFGLYLCFWLQLNMFQTLWWLTIIGGPTFFAGNRLLRRMNEVNTTLSKKSKDA